MADQITEPYTTLQGIATVHFADASGKDVFVAHLHPTQLEPAPVPKPASQPQPVRIAGEQRTLVAEVQGKPHGLDPTLTLLPLKFTGHKSTQPVDVFLDTGAAETMIGSSAAGMLGLPNLGPTTVMGTGGATNVYKSRVTITLGDFTTADAPCIVYNGSGPQLLLGADFFASQGFTLELDYKTRLIRIWQ